MDICHKFPGGTSIRPISLLSMMGNLFEKVILKIVHRHMKAKAS
jgi:hypothetical protein